MKFQLLIVLAATLVAPLVGVGQTTRTTASEKMVSLPTSLEGFASPNTLFLETGDPLTGGRREDVCYPQQFRNHALREEPVQRDWRIIVLENDYLRVEFAPELGGMIWRLFDKVHQRDVLYAPGSVRPTTDGFGGGYTAGGLELDYPYAHAITNIWPRKTEYKQDPDGSATYTVSEWERNGRTEWSISFRLAAGESRLQETMTIYNRSKLPASFVYWGNARVPATAATHWLYPEAMASEHGGNNFFTWPIFRNTDLSWLRSDPEVVGMYFLQSHYNFFGLVDEKNGEGLVHYADRHEVPGKKLWNWGLAPSDGPRKWISTLPEYDRMEPHKHGYEYGEIQSGRMVNQDYLEWLQPDESLSWNETWSPIQGLLNVNEVTEDAAFEWRPQEGKLRAYSFDSADLKLQVFSAGKLVKEIPFKGKPAKMQEIDLSGFSTEQLEIQVNKNEEPVGRISAVSRSHATSAAEADDDPPLDNHSSTSQTVWGEFNHKLLYRAKAREQFEKALQLDPINARAHLGLGRLLFESADFAGAQAQFKAAIRTDKWQAEAYLLLSQVEQIQGDLEAAEENAHQSVYYGEKARGNLKLAEIMIARGRYQSAKDFLEAGLRYNPDSLRSYALLALCERKQGSPERAWAQLQRSPRKPMQDLLWYSESWLSGHLDNAGLSRELFQDEWRYLEVGLDYFQLGAGQDASKMADAGIALHQHGWQLEKLMNPERMWGFGRKRETPFFYVLKGAIADSAGNADEAARQFAAGDYFEDYVDTNEPEFVPLLQAAAPHNGFANFWLGNFYYHSLRTHEAIEAWSKAAAKHPGQPQILRNLAVYAEFQEHDLPKASKLFREALAQEPADVFLRLDLIAEERARGAGAGEILKLFLDAPKEQRDSFLLTRGLLKAFTDAGQWTGAADYLSKIDRRWSDDTKTWYNFCIDYAEQLLSQGQAAPALEWINRAGAPPANVTGRSLPVDQFYRQREFFLTGTAYKLLGDARSQDYFRKVVNEPADHLFSEYIENSIQHDRFYTALALKELGMESTAREILSAINDYRVSQSLVPLRLESEELKRWQTIDPLAPKL
jgi:tetratricopeptide (TPR) repeat protein